MTEVKTYLKDEKDEKYDIDSEEMNIDNISIDQIIINLKIIALIKKYEKLSINEDYTSLVVDDKSNIFYVQAITRWLNNDNRQKTMKYIDNVVEKTFEWMDKVYNEYKTGDSNSDDIFEEDRESLLLRLSKEIINASEGLKNLRVTYRHDSLVNSQIQLMLDKIRIKINKINELLKIKWIIDKEYQSGGNYGE